MAASQELACLRSITNDFRDQVFFIVVSCGQGSRLPEEVAVRMKAELGGAGPAVAQAIDQVGIHTDDAAARAAHLLEAQAFTLGHHIYFERGAFAPGTDQGDRLLRHELTHVAQNARGALSAHGGLELVAESSATEAEARAAEMRPALLSSASHAPHGDAAHPADTTAERAAATSATPAAAPVAAAIPPRVAAAAPAAVTAPAAAPVSAAPISRSAAPRRASATTDTKRATTNTKGTASTVVDLLGKSSFEPPDEVAAAIDAAGPEGADVRVKLGSLTGSTAIRVKKAGEQEQGINQRSQLRPRGAQVEEQCSEPPRALGEVRSAPQWLRLVDDCPARPGC